MNDKAQKPSGSKKAQPQGTSSSLRGYPGYRTRAGRSGLDPIDNDAEMGHMAGGFVRRLLTGNLRTRNPITLVILAVLGLVCISPLFLAILEAFRANLLPLGAWGIMIIAGLFGIAMLVNVIKNLLHYRGK